MSSFREILMLCFREGRPWLLAPLVLLALYAELTRSEDELSISPSIYVQF